MLVTPPPGRPAQRCADAGEVSGQAAAGQGQPAACGDAAYGSGELIGRLDSAGIHNGIKCQPPAAVTGHFAKDRFAIDLDARTVTCPAGITVPLRPGGRDRQDAQARFGAACATCPLASQCTTAKGGRTIAIGPHEALLAAARIRQQDPAWKADYRATRPEVERKIGHLMRRRHGGRRGRDTHFPRSERAELA
jgi:Transposase DDE domain